MTRTTLQDSQVRRLAKTVELATDGQRFGVPGGLAAEVSLTIAGTSHAFTVSDWKGAPSDPYTYDEMAEKFTRYSAQRLPPGHTEAIIERVRHLEEVEDVADLARLLRSG